MKNLGRALLLVGVLVLALLIGLLVARGRRAEPTTAEGNAAAVQITTVAPPAAPLPEPTPLPAPVQEPAPPPVAIPRLPVDAQVLEDAAAVGMTTREDAAPAFGAETAPPPLSADTGAQSEPVG